MHDSHAYRIVQPQACIDELRADLKAIERVASSGGSHRVMIERILQFARATLERTK